MRNNMTKIEAIRQVLIDNNGIANWKIIYNETEKYCATVKSSEKWQEGIRGVLYRDIGQGGIVKVDTGIFALNEHYKQKALFPVEDDEILTDKELIVKVRTMQGFFRNNLLKTLHICPVTLISDERLLVASHIKPWCFSTNAERIDVNNGFLLSPLYDALFDKGLITFTNKKEMIVSSSLENDSRLKLGISEKTVDCLPICGREPYLKFHQNKIFIA